MQVFPTAPSPTVTHFINLDALISSSPNLIPRLSDWSFHELHQCFKREAPQQILRHLYQIPTLKWKETDNREKNPNPRPEGGERSASRELFSWGEKNEREERERWYLFRVRERKEERERGKWNETRNQCDRSGLRTGAYVCNVCLCAQTSWQNSY